MGCTVKVVTRVLPPTIAEMTQGNKQKFSGIELNILRCILRKLNLSLEYRFIASTNKTYFENTADKIEETVSGDTDIAVGGLTVSDRFILRADCTLPYLEYALK